MSLSRVQSINSISKTQFPPNMSNEQFNKTFKNAIYYSIQELKIFLYTNATAQALMKNQIHKN